MRAGTLRHRLIIERPDTSRDATGDETITWVREAEVWSSIEPFGGRESQGANQLLADVDSRITIRWSGAVDAMAPRWRLRHLTTVYDVQAVEHVMLGRREMRILAKSGKTDG